MCFVSAADFGLFLADEDPKKGCWLESGRTLEYYLLRNGVSITLCPPSPCWGTIEILFIRPSVTNLFVTNLSVIILFVTNL